MKRLPKWPAAVGFALVLAAAAFAQAPAPVPVAPPAGTPPAPAQPSLRDDREAIDAGMKWLALVDAGKAGAAWDLASQQLKSTVTRAKFVEGLRAVRQPLGKLDSRTPERFARAHELPGAPQGDYAIIEYTATFAKGKRLQEQLVWTIEDGDVWRVAGYYYR